MSEQSNRSDKQSPDKRVSASGNDWEKPRETVSPERALEIATRKAEARAKLVAGGVVKA